MAWPLIAAAAISAVSSYQQGQQEAAAFRDQARARQKQAEEFMKRFETNVEFTRLEGKKFGESQKAAFVKGGVALGSGVNVATMEDTARRIERRIRLDRIDAESKRDAILMGADLDEQRAELAQKNATIKAFGTLASTAASGSN